MERRYYIHIREIWKLSLREFKGFAQGAQTWGFGSKVFDS